MVRRAWGFVSFPLIVLIVVTVVSALLLGIGTLLTFVFAVSVWEATVVAMVVTGAIYWGVYGLGPYYVTDDYSVPPFEDGGEPRITITDAPFQSGQRRRRRRR